MPEFEFVTSQPHNDFAAATCSDDTDRMIAALEFVGNHVDRHCLYAALIDRLERTADPRLALYCHRHVTEFPMMLDALRQWDMTALGGTGEIPNVPSFEILAREFIKDGDLDAAVVIYRRAIALGVGSGDQTGYYRIQLEEIAAIRSGIPKVLEALESKGEALQTELYGVLGPTWPIMRKRILFQVLEARRAITRERKANTYLVRLVDDQG